MAHHQTVFYLAYDDENQLVSVIVTNSAPDERDTFTATQLRRKVWDMTGHCPNIVEGTPGAPTTNVIAVGAADRNSSVASIIAAWPDAKKPGPSP